MFLLSVLLPCTHFNKYICIVHSRLTNSVRGCVISILCINWTSYRVMWRGLNKSIFRIDCITRWLSILFLLHLCVSVAFECIIKWNIFEVWWVYMPHTLFLCYLSLLRYLVINCKCIWLWIVCSILSVNKIYTNGFSCIFSHGLYDL